jgi:hypothetical protein
MFRFRRIAASILLTAWPMAMLSCQARISDSNRRVEKAPQQSPNKISEPRPWPSAYPQPSGLRGLRSVALAVYADPGIPSDRIAPGPFTDEIKRRIADELTPTGILLTNENEAESILSIDMYLSCGLDGSSCGHHTDLELKQWVQLVRAPRITVAAITWQNSYMNGISRKEVWCCLPDQLEVDALSLIKGFIRDYRTANSK